MRWILPSGRMGCIGVLLAMLLLGTSRAHADTITIGSKNFTESYILAELYAQLIEAHSAHDVVRRFGLDTKICFDALQRGEIDLYPEYTGTIQEVLLKSPRPLDFEAINQSLQAQYGLTMGPRHGFNNTYALAIVAARAAEIRTISDLRAHPELRYGFSYQFLDRPDGWRAVRDHYGLRATSVKGIEHALAYVAMRQGTFDITDAYATDAQLDKFGLRLLTDDRQFFPRYDAVPLLRQTLGQHASDVMPILDQLAGRIDDDQMRRLNATAELEGQSFPQVAREFLRSEGLLAGQPTDHAAAPEARGLARLVGEHLLLTGIALVAAILIGLPLGVGLTRWPRLATPALAVVGLLQTIPSIALLAFMIPLFGIGTQPAIVALLLYGLLPIVRNTYTGVREIAPMYREVADGLGMTPWQRLWRIELPLASPMILAGIKLCAVISIGTATLAAFVGAGGLGEPIVTGLALNDTRLILRGAVPAAVLAIVTEYGFALLERGVVPKGLRA